MPLHGPKAGQWRAIGARTGARTAKPLAREAKGEAEGGPVAAWPLGRLPGHRHAAKMAAVHRDAAFQWLGRPQGVPLEVGGPPAGDFIGRWAGQDTRDTQDTQDCGRVGLRAWLLACAKPLGQRASRPLHGLPVARERNAQDARCPSGPVTGAKRQAGAILGVLGVLGVLAKALEREAA